MDKSVFVKHRNNFIEKIKEQSFALFFSGNPPHKTGDQSYKYVPNRNFYFLSGIKRENMILLLVKGKSTIKEYLFIDEPSEYANKWLGRRLTKAEASALSGINELNIRYNQEFSDFISQYVLSDSRKSVIGMPKICYLDLYHNAPLSKPLSLEKTDHIIKNYPEIKIRNANEILDLLRMKKSDEEVAQIEQAIEYTLSGISAIMQNAKPGVNEHQLEALFDFTIRLRNSEGVGFESIVAGGKNATILHYEANNQIVEAGKMILVDLGALNGVYSADISRTFPVDGVFTDRQKALYELVLSVNKRTMELVKPGIMVSELNQFAKDEIAKGLLELGIINNLDEVEKYYYHNVSHYLGLDVHDVGSYHIPLEAGVVLTIEPGVYIEAEEIGIRIEDNVLVTKDGYKNLSEKIIKEVAEIEELMKFNL